MEQQHTPSPALPEQPLNPYASPADETQVLPVDPAELVDASNGKRFANYIVDTVASACAIVVFAMIASLAGAEVWELLDSTLLNIVYWTLFYIFFEGVFQATPGKWVTRTVVVDLDGRRPRFTQILGRTVTRLVPFEPFTFFGSRPGGAHDHWSKTRVVERPR